MQGVRPGGPHEVYRDPERRRSLFALLHDGFPNLPERIARAAAEGFVWEDVTEPFLRFDGGEVVSHVGVLEHRIRLEGADVRVAGVHAVVTRSDRRHRGLARACLADACRWIDERYTIAKLGTDFPEVYAPHGFRPLTLHHFRVDHAGGEDRLRPLRAEERAGFLASLAGRDPVSHRYASLDPGWLVGIDLAIQRRTLGDLWVAEPLGAVVDLSVTDGVLDLHDVFAAELPTLADLLALAPPHRAVRLHVCPDRLAPHATPVPMPEAGVWMVRGPWPLPDEVPFAVGRLAEH